eukprot:6133876-Lingulodinium_polyedra.AAC.1
MHYDTWNNHHVQDLPHIQYCGQVALQQMEHGRYFIREEPAGTWIDHIECLDQVATHTDVVTQCMDQCMTGAKDEYGDP